MKLEEAISNLLEIKEDFDWDLQHKSSRTDEEINLANKYSKSIETVLQALDDSIPKRKIEYKLEELYTRYTKLKGWKNNEVVIKYHSDVKVLKELLEE